MKLRYNKPKIFRIGEVRLLPGLNIVDNDMFKEIERHPIFKDKVDKGDIEIIKSARGPRSIDDMVKDISEIYDVAMLRKLSDDSREAIASAAKAQLDKIDKASGTSE